MVRAGWEAAAVLGAILAAFSLEAWWQERAEGIAAREELQQVAVDLAENTRLIEVERRTHDRIASGVAEFQVRVSAAENGDVISVPDTIVTAFLAHPSYDPVVASMDRLLSSGRLPMIGDLELQAALSRWPREVEDALRNWDLQRQGVTEHIFPFFTSRDINVERAVKLRALWFPAEITAEAGRYRTSIPVSDGLRMLIAERESEVYYLRQKIAGFRDYQSDLLARVAAELR